MMNAEGTWNVVISTPIGKQTVVFEIRERDGRLSGTAREGEEVDELVDLIADGDRLKWTQSVTKPLRLTLTFDVTIDGTIMTGTAKAGMLPSSKLTGARVENAP